MNGTAGTEADRERVPFHPAWIGVPLTAEPSDPEEAARAEADAFFGPGKIILEKDDDLGEGYRIEGDRVTGGRTGLLYGVYGLIRARRTGREPAPGLQTPYYSLRMLQGWDNMDGTVERGYAGRSLWFEGGDFSYDPRRIRHLGRMLSGVGINVLCVNNVNVHEPAQELIGQKLPDLRRFADLLRPWGVRLMVTVDFAMPLRCGLPTADPLDPGVAEWWAERVRMIYAQIPDLAGFLVKADSEHRPGPNAYGRTHAQGANMLAAALRPFGGVLLWRAFVYNCMQDWRDTGTDRPRAAYDLYRPLDGQFDGNVILQVKYGPYDFQVREPASPLFYGMKDTALAMELQLAQEYTGQQTDLYAMPPLWRELWDQIGPEAVSAVAAVSNLGRDENWTGHPFAQLNLYAYGRFAWDPSCRPEEVIREWIRMTYALPAAEQEVLERVLLMSRSVYERYAATLGLGWMVRPETHYGPSPYGYEFDVWGTYTRADRNAVGVDRTAAGTGFVTQYPEPWRSLYADPQTCPEELLLFFHRLPYTHRMRDGRTLIQRIYDDHFLGAEQAGEMRSALERLDLPAGDRRTILERMDRQIRNAREWRDVINTFFYRFSGIPDARGRTIFP